MRALLLLCTPALLECSRAVFHVHLALSSSGESVRVSWRSGPGDVLGAGTSTVEFGFAPAALTQQASGGNWSWIDYNNPFGGTNRTYTHNLVELPPLPPGATIYYRCGDAHDGWSSVASFTAPRASFPQGAPLTAVIFGDMGYTNSQTLPALQDEALRQPDLFLSTGDYAYNLEYRDGAIGDAYQSAMESITSSTPTMGCVGNHEVMLDFIHYTHRYRAYVGDAPSSGLTPAGVAGLVGGLPNNHWYSFELGAGTPSGVHFLVLSSEAYFYYNLSAAQLAWARADLAAVDRARTPWIIAVAPRSIYCSCDSDCDGDAATLRAGLEPLLNEHRVDLFVNGHEHNTERHYAVRDGRLVTGPSAGAPGGNASRPEVLRDAAAPIYLVTGCAGNVEGHEIFQRPQPAYSAFRAATYGYSRLTVHNASALLLELVQADTGQEAPPGTVIDAMLLLRTRAA